MALNLSQNCYFRRAFTDPARFVQNARDVLEEAGNPEFDTIVGTGMSGSLVIPTLARGLGCMWVVIRKEGDGSHSYTNAEGTLGERWLFVDDFISGGGTLRRVRAGVEKAVSRHQRQDPRFVTAYAGAYLYERDEFRDANDKTIVSYGTATARSEA